MELELLLDLAERQARAVILGLHRRLIPSWLLISDQNKIHILGTPWNDQREKDLGKRMMRAEMRKRRTVAYSVVLEAWQAPATQEEVDSGHCVPAGQRPDRKEVVLAMATDGKNTCWRTWDMVRDSLEQVTELRLVPDAYNHTKVETWMTELLPR